jgi:hypothetical protein
MYSQTVNYDKMEWIMVLKTHYPHPDKMIETVTVSEDVGNPFELDRADCLEILHPIKLINRL